MSTVTEQPPNHETGARRRSRILPSPVTGQEIVLIGVIAVIWAVLAVATPAFLTAGSIQPLLVATAPIALVGVGMTIVIITGGIDVSVGGAIMVCSVLTAKALVGAELSLPLALLLSLAVGGLLGLVNGVLIAYGRVHAIIITFGTANLFLFVGLQIFGSSTVNGIPDTFGVFGRGEEGRTLGIPHAFGGIGSAAQYRSIREGLYDRITACQRGRRSRPGGRSRRRAADAPAGRRGGS